MELCREKMKMGPTGNKAQVGVYPFENSWKRASSKNVMEVVNNSSKQGRELMGSHISY